MPINAAELQKKIAERGPRYAITGTVTPGEHVITYADTGEAAEQCLQRFEQNLCYQVRVHVPDLPGMDIDLAQYGKELADARRVVEEKTAILRAAVHRAAEVGRAEAEIARTAGVDRMTVRKWLGK